MASVVGTISMAHSPLWALAPDPSPNSEGGAFVADVALARTVLEALAPDVVVVFGPDHARGLFYDCMPPFTIGVERLEGVGDYGTPKGELPLAGDLAHDVFRGVTARGFDPAISLALRIDHGLAQTYRCLVPGLDVPMIPVVVNSGCPPLPTFRRCADFGRAVGEAIAASPSTARVVTIGSGGMSHWPASIDAFDASISPEWRDFLVSGRTRVGEVEAARVARAQALADGNGVGQVAASWDRAVLASLLADPTSLAALDDPGAIAGGGPGAFELRTWAAATAAWGRPLVWSGYEPVPRWITGMGVVASAAPQTTGAQ